MRSKLVRHGAQPKPNTVPPLQERAKKDRGRPTATTPANRGLRTHSALTSMVLLRMLALLGSLTVRTPSLQVALI